NGGHGIMVGSSSANDSIVLNSIHNNSGNGIQVNGAAQSAPTVSSAKAGTGLVTGNVSGKANSSIYIELFACASGDGEGCTFVGSTSAKTDGSGKATFKLTLADGVLSDGTYVTATATNA